MDKRELRAGSLEEMDFRYRSRKKLFVQTCGDDGAKKGVLEDYGVELEGILFVWKR